MVGFMKARKSPWHSSHQYTQSSIVKFCLDQHFHMDCRPSPFKKFTILKIVPLILRSVHGHEKIIKA
jgi:hypothetical protein